ncbi:MAG: hypothetical protein HYZ34_14890 [Ignavibacteriae bacterium]|nr:hypothetical protein [Ignavibacteriota bacterium]
MAFLSVRSGMIVDKIADIQSNNMKKQLHTHSVDDIIGGAIEREKQMKIFYQEAVQEVGPDAHELLSSFSFQHDERISKLNTLLHEVEDLRELSASIAD